MKRKISLGHNSYASAPPVHDGNPANLVFLHQLFALFYGVFRLAGDRNWRHQFRELDGIGDLRVGHNSAAQITVGYDALEQGIG